MKFFFFFFCRGLKQTFFLVFFGRLEVFTFTFSCSVGTDLILLITNRSLKKENVNLVNAIMSSTCIILTQEQLLEIRNNYISVNKKLVLKNYQMLNRKKAVVTNRVMESTTVAPSVHYRAVENNRRTFVAKTIRILSMDIKSISILFYYYPC